MNNSNHKNAAGKKTDTVLGEGIVFEQALVKGCGTIRIDGQFSGTIDIKGHIILGKTGEVDGRISADSALLAGRFKGDLLVRDTLHATGTASVDGKIESGKLIVDEGAGFDGTFSVSKEPVKKTEPATKKE